MNESLLQAYISDRRSCDFPGFIREDIGSYVRYTPLLSDVDGFICFTSISEKQVDQEIRIQCE